jgi:hypothetical protein
MKKFIKNQLIKLLAKLLGEKTEKIFAVAIYRRKESGNEYIFSTVINANNKKDAFAKAFANIHDPDSFCYIAWQATEILIVNNYSGGKK